MSDVLIRKEKSEKSPNIKLRSYNFSLLIIELTNSLPNQKEYFVFHNQLSRSGTSIGANIHEAKAASSNLDFVNYYKIALKSAYETEYWLKLLIDSYPKYQTKCTEALIECQELCKMISSSILSLKSKNNQT